MTKKKYYSSLFFAGAIASSSFLLSAGSTTNTKTDYQQKKAALIEKIYQDISTSVQDYRQPPVLEFVYNEGKAPYYNAYYNPKRNTIHFGEGIYDLATKFGKDSINVMAAVIGHELAHFYKGHGWQHAFGKANPKTDIKKQVKQGMYDNENRAKMEAQADYYGGIFGYLAGYNTLAATPAFFDTLYTALSLDDKLDGYPSLQDRKAIYSNSQKMLQRLLPVFQAANVLNLVEEYEKAGICYDYIIETFPSREMYNNAGVALAQQALGYYTPEELQFIYPLGIDWTTRLQPTGTKGTSIDTKVLRKKLLQKSLVKLQKSVQLDPNYTAAYINLALVHSLLQEHDLAIGFASKAIQLPSSKLLLANAYLARGIAYANKRTKGDKATARQDFKTAQADNELLATANLEALQNNVFAKLFQKKAIEEIVGSEETIADIGIEALEALFDAQEDFSVTRIRKQTNERPSTLLVTIEEEEFDALLVSTSGSLSSMKGFLMTKPMYKGQTARGIAVGSHLSDIKKVYGEPTRLLSSVQGNYAFYKKTGLLFLLNADNKVISWLIYGG